MAHVAWSCVCEVGAYRVVEVEACSRIIHRGFPTMVGLVRIGPIIHQVLGGRKITPENSQVKRSATLLVLSLHISAPLANEELEEVSLARLGSDMECCVALVIRDPDLDP